MPTAFSLPHRLLRLGWLAGLPGLALILGVATPLLAPRVEGRLDAKAVAVARGAAETGAEPWLRVRIRGRDLVATGEAPDAAGRDAALARLVRMPGLRHVVGRIGIVADASPFVWTATRTGTDGIALSGNRPAEIGAGALAARLAPDLPPATRLTDEATSARGAPPDFAAASSFALEQLKPLAPGGTATIADTTLSFSGEAATVAGYEALRQAFAHPPQGYTMGKVDIRPAAIGDFRFAVSHERGGGFVLSGNVVSEAARDEVRALASDAAEGAPVEDRMQTARGIAEGIDPAALSRFAFQVSALMQDGSVSFADSTLTVAGTALDGQAVAEIGTLIREARPSGVKPGAVTLAALPLSPYKFAVRRDSDTVTISGHLPDAAARERVLSALRPRFFRERIVDRSRIADGAPPDLPGAVEIALGPLAMLATGEVRVTDRIVRLTGASLYRESARRSEADLARRMPAGWQAEVAVEAPAEGPASDPATCRASFQSTVQARPLTFSPGSSTLKADFYPLLDALVLLARRCPGERIEVTGHADPAGAAAAPKAALDGAVENTASVDESKPAPAAKPAAKEPPKEAKSEAKSEAGKPAPAKVQANKPTPPKEASAKTPPGKTPPGKTPPGKTPPDKTAPGRTAPATVEARPESKPDPKPAPPAEPEPDLTRQRALAIVEYLLQAGLPAGRIAVAPAGRASPAALGVGFTLRS